MKDTEQLGQALKLLREADADRGASPFLETRLRAAFREHHAKPRRSFASRWAWLGGALSSAAAVGFVAWRLATPAAVEAPKSVPPVAAVAPKPAAPAPVVKQERPVMAARKRPARVASPAPAPATLARAQEVQEFIALPYAPPLSSWDRGQVVRVRVPRQSLRSLGIPVNEERLFERVPADVLMGEDGLARGIRLVSGSER